MDVGSFLSNLRMPQSVLRVVSQKVALEALALRYDGSSDNIPGRELSGWDASKDPITSP